MAALTQIDQLLEDLQRVTGRVTRLEKELSDQRREQSRIKEKIRALASGGDGGAAASAPATDAQMEAVEAVRHQGGAATVSEVANAMGLTRAAANLRLTRAVKAGLLQRVTHGQYALVDVDEIESGGPEEGPSDYFGGGHPEDDSPPNGEVSSDYFSGGPDEDIPF